MTANSWESENVGVGARKDNANIVIPTGRGKKNPQKQNKPTFSILT